MPAADPSRIIDTLCAYWETAALRAAIDLDVFTALGRRARTASQLGAACAAAAAALGRLCDWLVSLGEGRANVEITVTNARGKVLEVNQDVLGRGGSRVRQDHSARTSPRPGGKWA